MARTWFGEIGPCCCLPPLLNLPAAFSQPRANHKGVPSSGYVCEVSQNPRCGHKIGALEEAHLVEASVHLVGGNQLLSGSEQH